MKSIKALAEIVTAHRTHCNKIFEGAACVNEITFSYTFLFGKTHTKRFLILVALLDMLTEILTLKIFPGKTEYRYRENIVNRYRYRYRYR